LGVAWSAWCLWPQNTLVTERLTLVHARKYKAQKFRMTFRGDDAGPSWQARRNLRPSVVAGSDNPTKVL
jgi:hypothetical protein